MTAPTMSTMASTAPTSWKCTFSGVVPCTFASAVARRSNMAMLFCFTHVESRR